MIVNLPSVFPSGYLPTVAGHRKGQLEKSNGSDFHRQSALSA
jgi:hypothetical protein